jgi:hypothetical protein
MSINTVTQMNGLYKDVYAEKNLNLVPTSTKLCDLIKFKSGEKLLGLKYVQSVLLGLENGITYGGSEGEAFDLISSSSAPVRAAEVKGHEMVLVSTISVGAASRSVSSKGAFESATKLVMGNMIRSLYHRLEIQLLYGQAGIAEIASVAGNTFVVKAHEWAPAIWNGSKGASLDFYSPLNVLRGTAKITTVDYDTKTITVDLLPVTVDADDKVYFSGAFSKEFIGIHEIAQKSGILFGIDNTQFDLFKGNILNVGTDATAGAAVLSFPAVERAIAVAMDKGLAQETVSLLCSTRSWTNLLTELMAKRELDQSYSTSKVDNGTKEITFHGMNGTIKIIPSTFVKEGYAYAMVDSDFSRIGSKDIGFEIPGYENEPFRLLENKNGYEIRAYTDQAVFCARPAALVLLRYIKS